MIFSQVPTNRFSLKLRIIIAFTLQTLLLAVIALSTINFYVDYIEESVLYEHLEKYLDAYVGRTAGSRPSAIPDDIKIYVGDDSNVPSFVRQLEPGSHEIESDNGGAYHALKKRYNGEWYYLVKDQTEFENRETEINFIALSILFLFAVVSFLFSKSLAERIVKPVVGLYRKVSRLDVENAGEIKLDYPDDEIGALVKLVYDQFNTLGRYLQREKWFTGDISHELRTPMMVISSSIDLLKQGSQTEQQKAKIYENIENAVKGVNELIGTFLLLARGKNAEENELLPTRIVDLVHEVVDNMKLFARGKEIEFKILGDMECVVALNPTLFSIVLSNLVKNAVFNTEKGDVTVFLSSSGFRVEDNGPGLPDVVKQFISGSATHARSRNNSHVGLGLSIVKRVCEREHWQVAASDRDGGGTVFMVDFHSNEVQG